MFILYERGKVQVDAEWWIGKGVGYRCQSYIGFGGSAFNMGHVAFSNKRGTKQNDTHYHKVGLTVCSVGSLT